jgi:hypothetical protein
VRVEGSAERNGVTEQFRWSFRKRYRFADCRAAGDAGDQMPILLVGGESTVQDISIHGEALFRDQPEPRASIRFSPFAAADLLLGDADGVVDFDELARVPLPVAGRIAASDGGSLDASIHFDASITAPDSLPDAGDASAPYTFSEGGMFVSSDGGKETVETLRDFVYILLVPMLARLQGTEQCAVEIRPMFGGF